MINATHILHVVSIARCVEGTFHLNTQYSTDICGARKNYASVPTTSEAAWTTLYLTSISLSVRVYQASDPLYTGSIPLETDLESLQVLCIRGSSCSSVSWLQCKPCLLHLVLYNWCKDCCLPFNLFKSLSLLRVLVEILILCHSVERALSLAATKESNNASCLCFLFVSWWWHGWYCINHIH